MNKFSKKRQKIENEYRKVWREKAADIHCCEGCGRSDLRITPSHFIDRKRSPHLIADPDNIGGHCIACQNKVETGRYNKLLDGEKIKEYIMEKDPEYYRIKTMKWE